MSEQRERRCRIRECGVPIPQRVLVPLCPSCRYCLKLGLASGGSLAFIAGLLWAWWVSLTG